MSNTRRTPTPTNDQKDEFIRRINAGIVHEVQEMLRSNRHLANISDPRGDTALILAIQEGTERVIELLMENGADPNKASRNDGATPLMTAASNSRTRIMRLLFENGANNVNAINRQKWTALMFAVSNNRNSDIVELLIENGARVNMQNDHQETALLIATQYRKDEIIRLLLRAGADPNIGDFRGTTPLLQAAHHGNVDRVRMFLGAGGNIRHKDNDGWTALMHAAQSGNVDTMRLLLERGARVNTSSNYGETPLMIAAGDGHVRAVEFLLDSDANPYALDDRHNSALSLAARYHHDRVVNAIKKYIIFNSAMHAASAAEAMKMNQDEALLFFKKTVKDNMKEIGYDFDVDSDNAQAKLYRYFKGVMRSRNRRPRTLKTTNLDKKCDFGDYTRFNLAKLDCKKLTKKQYRKIAIKIHPDKKSHLPEECVEEANIRTSILNNKYEDCNNKRSRTRTNASASSSSSSRTRTRFGKGKSNSKKPQKRPSSAVCARAQKLGVRLTLKRNNKRVYKSEEMLRAQIKNVVTKQNKRKQQKQKK